MNLRPDPTFHATPKLAMQAAVENYAFTVMLSPDGSQSDGIAVVDLNPVSETYGQIVHQVIVPNTGDEFIILAGMPALRRSRRSPGTLFWSVAI